MPICFLVLTKENTHAITTGIKNGLQIRTDNYLDFTLLKNFGQKTVI